MGRPPIFARPMTGIERSRRYRLRRKADRGRARVRCDTVVAIRFPSAVRAAIEQTAKREQCGLSEVVRRALRAAGLIDRDPA
jgi:hypothetical protein